MVKLLTLLSILYVASAKTFSEKAESATPVVEMSKYPDQGWEISDWLVGLMMGSYAPLVSYARDDDCFSAWFGWSVAAIDYSKYFNRGFNAKSVLSWIFLGISMFFLIKRSIYLPQVCYDEL